MIEMFREAVMGSCLVVLALIVGVVAFTVAAYACRKFKERMPWGRVLVMCAMACVCVCAAQKKRDNLVKLFNFDSQNQYIYGNRSYVEFTNDVVYVHIDFNVHPLVPMDATFCLDVRPVGETNEWQNYTTFILSEWQLPLDFTPDFLSELNWTNFEWAVYTDWTPAPSIVTNGVWHARAIRNGMYYIPLNVRLNNIENIEDEQTKEGEE